MTDFVALVSAISWPVAVVWIAYLFRRDVKSLLGRISHFKYNAVEASFKERLSETEEKLKEISAGQPSTLPGSDLLSKIEQLQRIAAVSPRAAILESWILIENAAGQSGFVQGGQVPRINSMLFVEWLIREGKLPASSIDVVSSLRELRNEAAHLPDFWVSRDEAERYIKIAATISTLMTAPG